MVYRISDDWTIQSEASWERSELKTAGVLGHFCVCMLLEHFRISFGALDFLAKKFRKKISHNKS